MKVYAATKNKGKIKEINKILQDAGIVTRTEIGKWSHYALSDEGRKNALEILTAILY